MKSINKDAFVKAFILVGFAIWIYYLLLSGSIDLYLSPSLTWLSKLSAILLITLTIATLIPSKHASKHCCCGHNHPFTSEHSHGPIKYDHSHSTLNLMKITIFCVPLLLGFIVKPQVLDSTTLVNSINTAGSLPFYITPFSEPNKLSATPKWPDWQSFAFKITGLVNNKLILNKGFTNSLSSSNPKVNYNISPSSLKSDKSALKTKLINPAALNLAETDLMQLALSDNPGQIYNHSYRLTGFVYKDPRLAKNQFVITRYVITCCIIDAQPIGIIAESPFATNLQANTWLEVEGVLKKRNINDLDKINPVHNFQAAENTAPYFIVTKLKKISTPKSPYLTAPQ